MRHINTLKMLYVFARSTPAASRGVHDQFEAAIIPQCEERGDTIANVGPVLASVAPKREAGGPLSFGYRALPSVASFNLSRLNIVLEPADLVANVIIATKARLRSGPEPEIGHERLKLNTLS